MRKTLLFLCFILLSNFIQAEACPGDISCYAKINYTTLPGCSPLPIEPIIFLPIVCPGVTYSVTLYSDPGHSGMIPNPVPASFFNQTIYVKVENDLGNICFSELIITTAFAPVPPGSVSCGDTFACKDLVNLSADVNCMAAVDANLFLVKSDPGDTYTVSIYEDPGYTTPVDNPVPYEKFDQVLYVLVENSGGNACPAQLIVEDKFPPIAIFFDDPGNLTCQDDFEALNLAGAIDACDPSPQVELIAIDFICRDRDNDKVGLTYRATDASNNSREAYFEAELTNFCLPFDLPEDLILNCPEEIPYPPEIQIIDNPSCSSTIIAGYLDTPDGNCGLYREYNYAEAFLSRTITHVQHIIVNDDTPPNFIANPDTEITYAELIANTYSPYLEVFDNCGIADLSISYEYLNPEGCDRPEFTLRYYMYAIDNCGNEITETNDVLVIRDGVARVRISGRRSCGEEFMVTAETSNLIPPVSYIWGVTDPSWGITPNPGSNTATVTPGTGSVDIEVLATDQQGCTVFATRRYTCNGRGIRGRSQNSAVDIFPNPFKSTVILQNIATYEEVQIIDIQGKVVGHFDLNHSEENIELELENIPTGLYIISLKNKELVVTRKLLKE